MVPIRARTVTELQGSTVCWRRGDDMGNISRLKMILVGCSVTDSYYDRDRENWVVLNVVRRSVDHGCSCQLCWTTWFERHMYQDIISANKHQLSLECMYHHFQIILVLYRAPYYSADAWQHSPTTYDRLPRISCEFGNLTLLQHFQPKVRCP